MKNILKIMIVMALFAITACGDSNKDFKGYVPIGEEPKLEWIKENNGWIPRYTVNIVLENGDTIPAHFYDSGAIMIGRLLLMYRNSNPDIKDKLVYVRGEILGVNHIIDTADYRE